MRGATWASVRIPWSGCSGRGRGPGAPRALPPPPPHGPPVPLDDDGGAAVELRDEAPWLGLGRRLAGPVVAGLLDLERGAVVPRTCSCPACVEAERELQALMKRDIRQETEAMLRHVRAVRRGAWQAGAGAAGRAPRA